MTDLASNVLTDAALHYGAFCSHHARLVFTLVQITSSTKICSFSASETSAKTSPQHFNEQNEDHYGN